MSAACIAACNAATMAACNAAIIASQNANRTAAMNARRRREAQVYYSQHREDYPQVTHLDCAREKSHDVAGTILMWVMIGMVVLAGAALIWVMVS